MSYISHCRPSSQRKLSERSHIKFTAAITSGEESEIAGLVKNSFHCCFTYILIDFFAGINLYTIDISKNFELCLYTYMNICICVSI